MAVYSRRLVVSLRYWLAYTPDLACTVQPPYTIRRSGWQGRNIPKRGVQPYLVVLEVPRFDPTFDSAHPPPVDITFSKPVAITRLEHIILEA